MQPALFLDRDGVIIENRDDYVLSWVDVIFYHEALTALARIKDLPYRIIIITNQSAVGRGFISLEDAKAVNDGIVKEIEAAGGRIDKVYTCPHAPWENCVCRKPKPGLFLQAAEELELDLSQSIMIGDALTDMQAAEAAGVGAVGMVRTGRGAEQEKLVEDGSAKFCIHEDLQEALEDLLPAHS